jgi:hypothetical protein
MVNVVEEAMCLRMTMVANLSASMANLNQKTDMVDEVEFVGSNEKNFLGGQKESNVEIVVMYFVMFLGAQYMLHLGMAQYMLHLGRAQYMLQFGVAQYVG